MSKSISFICLFLILGLQFALGQTKPLNGNFIHKPTHELIGGMTVFVQHITDAPGLKTKCQLIDLNDSNITLMDRNKKILVLNCIEVSGFWYVNYKSNISNNRFSAIKLNLLKDNISFEKK